SVPTGCKRRSRSTTNAPGSGSGGSGAIGWSDCQVSASIVTIDGLAKSSGDTDGGTLGRGGVPERPGRRELTASPSGVLRGDPTFTENREIGRPPSAPGICNPRVALWGRAAYRQPGGCT